MNEKRVLITPEESARIAREQLTLSDYHNAMRFLDAWIALDKAHIRPEFKADDLNFLYQFGYAALFLAGVIQGKREERQRRKGGAAYG